MKRNINILKFLVIINPIIVILSIYIADINYSLIKSLLAGSVMILCSLEYALLDKLYKMTREDWTKLVSPSSIMTNSHKAIWGLNY